VFCDTPGDDDSFVHIGCSSNPWLFADLQTVHVQGDAGGLSATCPLGTEVVFGWSLQHSTEVGGTACFSANNMACTPGETTCSQTVCDTPGDDEAFIYLACAPPGHPLFALESVSAQGGSDPVVASCPGDEVIALGWSVQLSDHTAWTSCLKGNTTACPQGAAMCQTATCDTPGHDETVVHLQCLQTSGN